MKLIVGLGNPGSEYAGTRHNVGYRVVDRLAQRWSIAIGRAKFDGLVGDGPIKGEPAVLLKPMTYMNRSGQSVVQAWRFYKLDYPDVMVISDDMDLPLGRVRLRSRGSSGGQKGLGDILARLDSDDVPRLRVGIGRHPRQDAVNYVLSRFTPDDLPTVERIVDRATDAVENWIAEGIAEAMNRTNDPQLDDCESQ